MAKGVYSGINDTARKSRKMYVGVDNVARRIKKMYVGVGNVARLCYTALVKVFYSSNLALSFTEKEVDIGTAYGSFPLTANSNRVDFWFHTEAKAVHDSSKKYVDYPWCAYADANSDVYSTYGYTQDALAQHWNEHGASEGRILGDVTSSTLCTKEVDHALQHAYRSKVVTITGTSNTTSGKGAYVTLVNSKNTTKVKEFDAGSGTVTATAYPGMLLLCNAQHVNGLTGIGSDGSACFVKVNGTKVSGAGVYTYVIPNDVKNITMSMSIDNHMDGGQSWQINLSTTTI